MSLWAQYPSFPDVTRNCPHCDLRQARLFGAELAGADLRGAFFKSTDLRDADIANTNLQNAVLTAAVWVDGRVCGKGSVGGCK